MPDKIGIRTLVQRAFQVGYGTPVPVRLQGSAGERREKRHIQVKRHGQTQLPGLPEKGDTPGIIEREAELPFAARFHAEEPNRGFQFLGCMWIARVGTVPRHKAIRIASAGLYDALQREPDVVASRVQRFGIDPFVHLIGPALPGQDPGEVNTVFVHVAYHTLVVVTVPEDMLMRVNDHRNPLHMRFWICDLRFGNQKSKITRPSCS